MDVNADPKAWADYNATPEAVSLAQRNLVAPFPPKNLMQRVSGLTDPLHFAQHGRDIFLGIGRASPKRLSQFKNILDFGVGSGRLARMFKGFGGNYTGADIDHELATWVASAMSWVTPMLTAPRQRLPCPDASFDCVISVSVFTHMNEADAAFYLWELHRVTKPGATLLLTVHGEKALKRAETEDSIFQMLSVPRSGIEEARRRMEDPGFTFIIQREGHLTSDTYEYGISFTGVHYVQSQWARLFTVEKIVPGAIHEFQDIVVLKR